MSCRTHWEGSSTIPLYRILPGPSSACMNCSLSSSTHCIQVFVFHKWLKFMDNLAIIHTLRIHTEMMDWSAEGNGLSPSDIPPRLRVTTKRLAFSSVSWGVPSTKSAIEIAMTSQRRNPISDNCRKTRSSCGSKRSELQS